ncbi:MAG: M3 family metallopeptidase [Nannocystaceae bacterium]
MNADNPLLSTSLPIPFDLIEPGHVEPAITLLIQQAECGLDAIRHLDGVPTYGTVVSALEHASEKLERAVDIVAHLENVATTTELRAAYNAILPRVSAFFSSIPLDADLWRVLSAYADTNEAAQLGGTQARLLRKTVDSFRRHGAMLDNPSKEELAALDVELTKLTTAFGEHVLDSTNAFELVIHEEAQLAGLPESARSAARTSAETKGIEGHRFTLQEPSFGPLLTYLDHRATRERVWRAHNTRATSGTFDNRALIPKILSLRHRKATLLGYTNFADFVLEDRMARNGAKAASFVADLRVRTEAAFASERADLVAFYEQRRTPAEKGPLMPWDLAYYAEKKRLAEYDLDEEQLRPYFRLESVLSGLFEVANRLYGLDIRPAHDVPVWHEDVRTYAVEESGRYVGSFYADLLPRESKRPGAWMQGLVVGDRRRDGTRSPHVALICGNLTPPTAGRPSLLTHREVETIFHEFGHLLHHLLTEVDSRSLAGTNVAWDFVELPSQIMENWCWERDALALFAEHYQTGATIPDSLFDRMNRARKFRSASAMMRQLGFADVDLALHTEYEADTGGDLLHYCRERFQPFSATPLPDTFAMICGFSHLFCSPVAYAAGYYSYKWAEVLDADAFTAFQREGLLNPKTGARFRSEILARGDSRDPAESFQAFMGRAPAVGPLLRRSGLDVDTGAKVEVKAG